MDEFKLFIREKKQEMDIDEPTLEVWENIRTAAVKEKIFRYKLIAAASTIIVIIGAVFLSNIFYSSKTALTANNQTKIPSVDTTQNNPLNTQNSLRSEYATVVKKPLLVHNKNGIKKEVHKPIPNNNNVDQQSSVVQGFGEMQKSFAIIINHQINTLRKTPLYSGEDGNSFNVFKKGLQDLNTDEENTKAEVYQTGLHDVQIEKLINIYQQKIVLLKKLQSEIAKVNLHSLKDSAISTEKIKPTYINL